MGPFSGVSQDPKVLLYVLTGRGKLWPPYYCPTVQYDAYVGMPVISPSQRDGTSASDG